MKWILRGLLALVLGLAILVALALQTAPAVPPSATPTTADGAALRDLVQRLDPRRLVHLRPALLAVTVSELNLLLSLAAQQRPGTGVRLDVQDARLLLRASVPLGGFWLNLQAELHQEQGWPSLHGIRLGSAPLPASLTRWALLAWLDRQNALEPLRALRFLAEQIRFRPGQVHVMLRWRPDSVERLLNGVWPPAERDRALAYQQALAGWAAQRRAGTPVSLAEVLHTLFALAEQRTAAGADPAAENRMALLTLAVNMSGRGWAKLLPLAQAWPALPPLNLRLVGRDDFPLHWAYSAAIAAAAGGPLSDIIGIDKELADARGGSGFSFNDLAADRAGSRVGELALSQPLHVQRLLARPHAESLLLPEVADLPEFLTEAQLKQMYGGLNGPGYRRLMALIESRIQAMPLMNPGLPGITAGATAASQPHNAPP